MPEVLEYPTEGGLTAFMNFYPPANKTCKLPAGELPPLLIKIHGGPTSQASSAFSLGIQYWTSRGAPFLPAQRLNRTPTRGLIAHWVPTRHLGRHVQRCSTRLHYRQHMTGCLTLFGELVLRGES